MEFLRSWWLTKVDNDSYEILNERDSAISIIGASGVHLWVGFIDTVVTARFEARLRE